jgi:hypothetical protein
MLGKDGLKSAKSRQSAGHKPGFGAFIAIGLAGLALLHADAYLCRLLF